MKRDAPEGMSERDWAARQELAACYRIFALLGWSELIFSHITLRLAGPERRFLINPFGLTYDEVCASNLVTIDLEGRVIGPSTFRVNPAGFVLHSAFHAAREDAACVMHVHTTAGLAIASSAEGLVDCNFYSAQLHGEVAYHDFEGITLRGDEKPRLVRDMGDRHAMILKNHGLVTIGRDVPEAFAFMWTLQRACEVQLAARTLGEIIEIPSAISESASRQAFQFDGGDTARVMFDALRRKVEKIDASFAT